MDAQLKADWVKALRSGEFEQARELLTDGKGYCCLGVLCKVAGLQLSGGNAVIGPSGNPAGYTPITQLLGGVPYYDLSERNDGNSDYHSHTFAELADYIEANL